MGGPSAQALEDLLLHEPKFILDVGDGNGDFAAKAKQRFLLAQVWGVEPNEEAARIATTKVDKVKVICQSFEKIDWKREGIERGDIDTAFLFDVLGHIHDPWHTLLDLRNLICASAQVIVSIPNVRNVLRNSRLDSGSSRYRRAGLLDITQIRFFSERHVSDVLNTGMDSFL